MQRCLIPWDVISMKKGHSIYILTSDIGDILT